MSEKYLFHGAGSEIITPFGEDNQIDYGLLKAEVEFMTDKGVTGYFVNGLASEALMFTMEERIKVVEAAVQAARGRVPIMGNLIHNNPEHAIQCIRGYEAVGANAIAITPPLVYKYTNQALFEYFDTIAKATQLPVYIYNAPESNNKVPPEVLGRLLRETPNFTGYKDSTQDIIHLQTVLDQIPEGRHFELMAGSDAQIATTMMIGGKGVLSLITCLFPKLIIDVCAACDKGDWDTAMELQKKVLRVRQALKTGPFMAAYKYIGKITDTPMGNMKKPLSELSQAEQEKVTALLKTEGMI